MRCLILLSLVQQLVLALSMQTAISSKCEPAKAIERTDAAPSFPIDNTATSSAVCNITAENGIPFQTITLEEQSSSTGAKISLKAKQEIPLSINDIISAWGGITGPVSIWHDSDLLFSKRSTIFPNNRYKEVIQWGPLIKEANQTSNSIDCSGVLAGDMAGKKFKPVHYLRVRHGLVFENGTSLPNPAIPDTVNETLYSVLGNLEQGIGLCTGRSARGHPVLPFVLWQSECQKFLIGTAIGVPILGIICVVGWVPLVGLLPALVICGVADAAVALEALGSCYFGAGGCRQGSARCDIGMLCKGAAVNQLALSGKSA